MYVIICCGYSNSYMYHHYGQRFSYSFSTFTGCLLCLVFAAGKLIHRMDIYFLNKEMVFLGGLKLLLVLYHW